MAKKAVHITPSGNNWKVRTAGSERAVKITSTQSEAIQVGRRIAINQKSELIVHRANGTIGRKDSFGNDPHPPKG